MITIQPCSEKTARALWSLTAPSDSWHGQKDLHWSAVDGETPIAFASVRVLDDGEGVFLSAAGVIPLYRGQKLHQRLIRARVNWARRKGLKYLLTYTILKNYPSMMSLLKANFKFYEPEYKWQGDNVHYFIKYL